MSMLHQAIKDAVFEAVRKSDFDVSLPPLSDATWAKLLGESAMWERERLEFVGDALMYSTIGTILYQRIPDGTPHMYTNLRDILHSNAVHSLVAEKLDILAVPDVVLKYLSGLDFGEGVSAPTTKSGHRVKATADLFETVLGAYYFENGFGSLCEWVGKLYAPLITSAKQAFDKCMLLPKGKRRRPYGDQAAGVHAKEYKRLKLANRPVPLGSRTNIKRVGHVPNDTRQVVASMSMKTASGGRSTTSTVKVKTTMSTPAKHRVSPRKKRTPPGTRKTVAQPKAKAVFIDLTLSSDSSEDEVDRTATRPTCRPTSTRAKGGASSGTPRGMLPSSRFASQSDEDLQEEAMLERMLLPHAGSDMELESDEDDDSGDDEDMDLGSDDSYLVVYD